MDARKENDTNESMWTPYRVDLWAIAAICAAIINATSIWIFFSSGTGAILEPILTPLAHHSVAWIPVYSLAVPLLIPFMPNTARETIAALFVATGMIFGTNNLCGHFLGRFIFVDNFGLYPTFACCVLIAVAVLAFSLMRSGNVIRAIQGTALWGFIALAVHGVFLVISRIV